MKYLSFKKNVRTLRIVCIGAYFVNVSHNDVLGEKSLGNSLFPCLHLLNIVRKIVSKIKPIADRPRIVKNSN